MKKFIIWTHYDTGIQQIIKAENEEDALKKAIKNLENENFEKQLRGNLQRGETDITGKE